MHDGLYSNRNSRGDFIINSFEHFASRDSECFFAVPFFTNTEQILLLTEKGCQIRLVVRLGYPTNPVALEKILTNKSVQVRYFTDHSFHSKLYIFGSEVALVGSANLTKSAFKTNQEILVSIPLDDPRFQDLVLLFSEYWTDSKVLTSDVIRRYSSLCSKHDEASTKMFNFDQDIIGEFGKIVSKNIRRGEKGENQESIFLETYRKLYQETVSAFNEVRKIYESINKRKVEEKVIPLRLEIDSFISWVREIHASGEKWAVIDLLNPTDRSKKIEPLILEWLQAKWPWFDENIVHDRYPVILSVFGNAGSINIASDDELFEALCVVHSFHDRRRFYSGGLLGIKSEFFALNERSHINRSLSYLIHGQEETVRRMCNLIYNPSFKLNSFGQSNVQELVGWINHEELPVVNGRTTKVLHFFGFNVNQV